MHAAIAAGQTPGPFHPASSPDYVPREPLRGLQSQRLRQVVGRAFEHVAVYRQRMQKHGLTPAEIHGVEDIHKLPFTGRSDLDDAYPFGMLAVPVQQVARLHCPGASGGGPVALAMSRGDLEVWTELVVRCLASCGLQQGDVIQNACGCDLFPEGLGLHYGAEALGATVVPGPGGDVARRVTRIKDFGVTAVCSTPSYFLRVIERAEKMGVDLGELSLRVGIFFAEPWSEAVRQRIEESAGIKAYDLFGLPEVTGPGAGVECCRQDGLHIFEDHFYPEIVDPESGEPLAEGQEGELVLTTLSREAMPLIRYRTRKITAILAEPCGCGRTMRRIRRIEGRSDEMFVVEGVEVLPEQIEAALAAVQGTVPEYRIELSEQNGVERVEVQVEVTPQIFSDRISAMESLQSRLAREIERTLGINLTVRFVEPHTVKRGQSRQAGRVVDRRNT